VENLILQKCRGNAVVPARAGGDVEGRVAPAIHCENRCPYVSSRPPRCSSRSFFSVLGFDIAAPSLHFAALEGVGEWGGMGGVRDSAWPSGRAAPKLGLGLVVAVIGGGFLFKNKTSVKSVAFHSEPCREDIGRRCFHSSCHTVFLCKKNVKLLYNLFLIWVCCSHLFQPSREL